MVWSGLVWYRTGTIPDALGIAFRRTLNGTIRLDGNQLTGSIPSTLGSLSGANYLTLDVRSVTFCFS